MGQTDRKRRKLKVFPYLLIVIQKSTFVSLSFSKWVQSTVASIKWVQSPMASVPQALIPLASIPLASFRQSPPVHMGFAVETIKFHLK